MANRSFTRREFAAAFAGGAAAIPLSSVIAGPPETPRKNQPAPSESDTQQAPSKPDEPQTDETKQPAEADLLLEIIQRRYPDERLTEEVLAHIRGELEVDLFRSKMLSRYPLRNGDEPAFVFSAYRGD